MWNVRTLEDKNYQLDKSEIQRLLIDNQLTAEDWCVRTDSQDWTQFGDSDDFADCLRVTSRVTTDAGELDVDMTPMIDVTFLLLVFFMITATFHLQKGLDFPTDGDQSQSSDAEAPGLSEFPDQIIVGIDAQDRFSIRDAQNQALDGLSNIPASEMPDTLRRLAEEGDKSGVLILADDQCTHAAAVVVIDSAAQAGLTDIVIADPSSQ